MTSLPVLQPVEYGFFPLQLPWLQLAAAAGPAVTNRAAATSATAPRTAPSRRRIRLPNRCWPDVQTEDMVGPFADALSGVPARGMPGYSDILRVSAGCRSSESDELGHSRTAGVSDRAVTRAAERPAGSGGPARRGWPRPGRPRRTAGRRARVRRLAPAGRPPPPGNGAPGPAAGPGPPARPAGRPPRRPRPPG